MVHSYQVWPGHRAAPTACETKRSCRGHLVVRRQIESLPFIEKAHIHLIYNPIIQPDFPTLMIDKPVLPADLDPNVPTLVAVGRLHRQKDYPTLFKALATVRKWRPAQLIVLGDGELGDELKALARSLGIADLVHFLGFRPNPLAYMHHADAFVLSSAWEGFGNVVVEALATGTPVISTDCPHGPAEILDYGVFGTLVPVGDSEAMAEAIINVLAAGKAPMSAELRSHLKKFAAADKAQQHIEIFDITSRDNSNHLDRPNRPGF